MYAKYSTFEKKNFGYIFYEQNNTIVEYVKYL